VLLFFFFAELDGQGENGAGDSDRDGRMKTPSTEWSVAVPGPVVAAAPSMASTGAAGLAGALGVVTEPGSGVLEPVGGAVVSVGGGVVLGVGVGVGVGTVLDGGLLLAGGVGAVLDELLGAGVALPLGKAPTALHLEAAGDVTCAVTGAPGGLAPPGGNAVEPWPFRFDAPDPPPFPG
jgi:hypothetical protein